MPTYQGARFLGRVLDALAAQRVQVPWDFTAVDCGSSDGTLELFARRAPTFPVPLNVRRIDKREFNHGDTRNLLAALSGGELLVFMTDDAIPAGEDWLEQLARNFDDPRVGGAYCRNVPRPEANLLTTIFSRNDPNYAAGRRVTCLPPADTYLRMEPEELRELYNYCDTASALRRALWQRHPYPRCEGMEDVLMARALLEAGHAIVYDDAAVVQHSHEYRADRTRARAHVDGVINAEWLDRVAVGSLEEVSELVDRQLLRDRAALEQAGLDDEHVQNELREAEALRRAYYQGLYEGGRSTRRVRSTKMLANPCLCILHVVAVERGDETVQVLRDAMRARGHAFEVCNGSEAAREGLAQTLPDLMHIEQAAHPSRELLDLARELGVPVLVECNAPVVEPLRSAASLFVCLDRGLFDSLTAEGELHPDLLVPALPKPDCEPVDEWESRYRAVACHKRDRQAETLMRRRGAAAVARSGDVSPQGPHCLLLHRVSSAVEYELDLARGGRFSIRLWIPTLAGEGQLVFGGRVLVDGVACGLVHPFTTGAGQDEVRIIDVPAEIPLRARTLRIENILEDGAAPYNLRVQLIEIVDRKRNALDLTARQAQDVQGEVTRQGPDMMMMGPGIASLEYSLERVGAGPVDLALTVPFERDESGVEFAGRLLIDGLPLARIGPLFGRGEGELHVLKRRVTLPSGTHSLRIENRKRRSGGSKLLRVKRLVVEPPATDGRAPAPALDVLTKLRARLDLPRPLDLETRSRA
jgi:GT2 family glycosyltransferase